MLAAQAMPGVSSPSTRRAFLALAGSTVGGLAAAGRAPARDARRGAGTDLPSVARYLSRPDLTPPTLAVAVSSPTAASGYVFLAPATGPGQNGPLIVDSTGEPVWFSPAPAGKTIHNFTTQKLGGRPVLTWWEGVQEQGKGQGEYVIADTAYRELKRLRAGNGYQGDLHEFLLTTRGTALITIYDDVPSGSGTLTEGIVQELDVATGAVVFEWHSLDHVGNDESYQPGGDYFHLNSVGVLDDGDLLVSARHTSAIYKLDRRTGDVVWRLGGKKSDFELGPGAAFAYQHDARGHEHDLVTIFDDGAYSPTERVENVSRAITLRLDTGAMTATLAQGDPNPHGALSVAEGSAQRLPDGGMFAGWGTVTGCSEFSPSGELRFDAAFVGGATSYRARRLAWSGKPSGRPAIAVVADPAGGFDVHASWNGATAVHGWRLLAGPSARALAGVLTTRRTGFETVLRLAATSGSVAVEALDADGHVLGASAAVAL